MKANDCLEDYQLDNKELKHVLGGVTHGSDSRGFYVQWREGGTIYRRYLTRNA